MNHFTLVSNGFWWFHWFYVPYTRSNAPFLCITFQMPEFSSQYQQAEYFTSTLQIDSIMDLYRLHFVVNLMDVTAAPDSVKPGHCCCWGDVLIQISAMGQPSMERVARQYLKVVYLFEPYSCRYLLCHCKGPWLFLSVLISVLYVFQLTAERCSFSTYHPFCSLCSAEEKLLLFPNL